MCVGRFVVDSFIICGQWSGNQGDINQGVDGRRQDSLLASGGAVNHISFLLLIFVAVEAAVNRCPYNRTGN